MNVLNSQLFGQALAESCVLNWPIFHNTGYIVQHWPTLYALAHYPKHCPLMHYIGQLHIAEKKEHYNRPTKTKLAPMVTDTPCQ